MLQFRVVHVYEHFIYHVVLCYIFFYFFTQYDLMHVPVVLA
jgi:hypothetical protein